MLAICVALLSGSALTGVAASPATAGPANVGTVQSKLTTTGDGYTLVEGEKAGALFAALRPDVWNGHLVLLLHGKVSPNEPVQLPPPGHEPLWSDLIDRLASEGYGVAYSSYRANGDAFHEGVLDTRVAQAMFTSAFGKPDETYLMSFSMGTHVGQKLVETASARYDGWLAICGALGGATLQWEYMVNTRILFDYYFPGALPENVWSKTDLDFFDEVLPVVLAAITESPEAFGRAVELAGIDQLAIPWTTPDELVFGIVLALAGAGGGSGDMQAKAGGIVIDNTTTRYTGSSDDDALNAGVGRFAADPNARQYLRRYDPDGTLKGTPVLALHTTGDTLVPHWIHFPAYQALLAEAGNEHLFVTRLFDSANHCDISAGEIFDSFQDLVNWANTGTAPQS